MLTLSEWIQSAVPYGTAFFLINILLVAGRIFSEIWLVAGGIGLGLVRGILAYKCFRAPSNFENQIRIVRWSKSILSAGLMLLAFLIGHYVTNFVLDSSNFGYYIGVWLGFEFSLFLLWEWTVRQGFLNRFKKSINPVYE